MLSSQPVVSTNPGDDYRVLGQVSSSSAADIQAAFSGARHMHRSGYWRGLRVEDRAEALRAIFNAACEHRQDFEALIVSEIGKTRSFAHASYTRFLDDFEWTLENAAAALAPIETINHPDKGIHHIQFRPTGVAAVIAPWNHPFGMFVWGVIPNLLAGNPVVFKHSEESILSAKFIDEHLVSAANLKPGVYTQIFGGRDVGEFMSQQDYDLLWFTGSTRTGRTLNSIAGQKLATCIMELGGSNPGIILADADLEAAVEKSYAKRFQNCGQACDALKRLLVHRSVASDVEARLKRRIEQAKIGPNTDPATQIGSLAARSQFENLHRQVQSAIEHGARLVIGGHPVSRPDLKGAFYSPTLLADMQPDNPMWKEEFFGPVLMLSTFDDDEQAIKLANDSDYGLGALVFAADSAEGLQRGRTIAEKLDAGSVEINQSSHWYPENPFGGHKSSGVGREHGVEGFRQLCQMTVLSRPSD